MTNDYFVTGKDVYYWEAQIEIKFESEPPLPYKVEMFYLNSTLNFGIPPVLVFQLEVYYQVDFQLV